MSSKEFFPHLNAFRFIAALLVILHHVEQVRQNAHLFHLKNYSLFNNGGVGVQFFFVLSGFLITFLLLKEKQRTGTVLLSLFYLKRVLRIWPLYYLLVFVGFVVLPLTVSPAILANKFPYLNSKGLLLYLFILPNVANALWSKHFLITLWSIGVEEQFYLIWAPVAKWLNKYMVQICFSLIALKLAYDSFILTHCPPPILVQEVVASIRFDCMAVGGLIAIWLHKGIAERWKNILYARPLEVLLIVLLFLFLIVRLTMVAHCAFPFQYLLNSHWGIQLFNLVFGLTILNAATNPRTLFALNHKWLDYLGKISYGLYMYHMLFTFAVVDLIKNRPFLHTPFIATATVYAGVLGLTFATSAISYQVFEQPILRLKAKFYQ